MAVYDKNEKCLICASRHIYSERVTSAKCMFCGDSFYTNLVCVNGHYVCDDCHMERALEIITSTCKKSAKREAVGIAYDLLMNKWVKMHSPEHAFLVTATLLTAYRNRRYGADTAMQNFNELLEEAKNRTMKIASNSCGYWGCAGEAIACGIFASIVLKATPMSVKERGLANFVTAKVLEQISMYGGPRCSKRESFIAILTASKVFEERLHMPLTGFESVECMFVERNSDCIGGRCPFFPDNNKESAKQAEDEAGMNAEPSRSENRDRRESRAKPEEPARQEEPAKPEGQGKREGPGRWAEIVKRKEKAKQEEPAKQETKGKVEEQAKWDLQIEWDGQPKREEMPKQEEKPKREEKTKRKK